MYKKSLVTLVEDPLAGGYMLNSWADQVAIAALDIFGTRRFL